MMVRIIDNFFGWYSTSRALIGLFIWVFGMGTMLFLGGRYLAQSAKATYGRSLLANIFSGFAGMVIFGVINFIATAVSDLIHSPIPAIFGFGIAITMALLVSWWIIGKMFRVSFGEAILAWVPMFCTAIFLTLFLPMGFFHPRARELAKRAVCAANLNGIGKSVIIYQAENEDAFPFSLEVLLEDGISEKILICPSDTSGRKCSYFYLAPKNVESPKQTMIACDRKGHHKDYRNVLYADIHVANMNEAEFQAALAEPCNAAFAEALRRAEQPNAP